MRQLSKETPCFLTSVLVFTGKARLNDRLLMYSFSAWHIHKPTEFFIAESQDALSPAR